MGRQKKRYSSMKMLYELAIEDEIFSILARHKDELYIKILSDCILDEKIWDGNIEKINLNDIFQQYFEALKSVVDNIIKEDSLEDKLKLLITAEANIKHYNQSETLQKINGKHIESYKSALSGFMDDNFIFL